MSHLRIVAICNHFHLVWKMKKSPRFVCMNVTSDVWPGLWMRLWQKEPRHFLSASMGWKKKRERETLRVSVVLDANRNLLCDQVEGTVAKWEVHIDPDTRGTLWDKKDKREKYNSQQKRKLKSRPRTRLVKGEVYKPLSRAPNRHNPIFIHN